MGNVCTEHVPTSFYRGRLHVVYNSGGVDLFLILLFSLSLSLCLTIYLSILFSLSIHSVSFFCCCSSPSVLCLEHLDYCFFFCFFLPALCFILYFILFYIQFFNSSLLSDIAGLVSSNDISLSRIPFLHFSSPEYPTIHTHIYTYTSILLSNW